MSPGADIAAVVTPCPGYDLDPLCDSVDRVFRRWVDADPVLEGKEDPLVVIKPNWIQEAREDDPGVWIPVITHPHLVVAVLQAVAERLRGRGTIVICDAPHTYADFSAILSRGGLLGLIGSARARFPKTRIEVLDLRRETWVRKEEVVVRRIPNEPDPRGYVPFDLGSDSFLHAHAGAGRYYGADYDTGVVNVHHTGGAHEYLLSGTVVSCDLFINLPKLKTHKKTGLTCCLKNLVGINGDKNWLPHHTEGAPATGGDEFPDAGALRRLEAALKKAGREAALRSPILGGWAFRKARAAGKRVLGDSGTTIRNGNWEGNDTCWRMALDLNRALLHGRPDGVLAEGPRRPYLAIVDGIVGGEGNGPLCPDPVESGVLLSGIDPAAVDLAACRIMGFDPDRIPIVKNAFAALRWPITGERPDALRASDERTGETLSVGSLRPAVAPGFRPHFGWPSLAGAPR